MTAQPRKWSDAELAADVLKAIAEFRRKRIGEPLSVWKSTFFKRRRMVRLTFKELNLRNPSRIHSRQIADVYAKSLGDVLRYMAAPPISADDLKVLSDSTLSLKALRTAPWQARSVLRTLLAALDPLRFPWVEGLKRPSASEWKAAIAATTSLMTAQAVATYRRNTGKDEQEQATKDFLRSIGLVEVDARKITTLRDAPEPGSFCGESEVWGEKADIVVSLFDGRLLLIECKVSNSAINSVKRVNHEAAGKAAHWTAKFGAQAVTAAMLSGVFKARNLSQAQDKGLTLFWSHRFSDLHDFIKPAKSGP